MLPVYEPDFWRGSPTMPAADRARLLAFAKKGRSFQRPLVIPAPGSPTPEMQRALVEQQRRDLERSLD